MPSATDTAEPGRQAVRLTGDLEEAKDVRQMALIKTYRGLEKDPLSALTTVVLAAVFLYALPGVVDWLLLKAVWVTHADTCQAASRADAVTSNRFSTKPSTPNLKRHWQAKSATMIFRKSKTRSKTISSAKTPICKV